MISLRSHKVKKCCSNCCYFKNHKDFNHKVCYKGQIGAIVFDVNNWSCIYFKLKKDV